MTTSLLDVQARWGYSEIVDATLSHYYDNVNGIEALRVKRREGIPFNQLAAAERYALAFGCACVRPNLFVYFVGTKGFDLVQLNRDAIGHLIVPPNVWRDSQGQFHPFSHYITTTTDEVGDARLLGPPPNGYLVPADPLTVGHSFTHPIMLDGYHRAALFWKYGPPEGTLFVYMPQLTEG